ncbi:MAG: hypothetical protein AB7N80_02775 [Bdellovibrionales bacterium]
MRIWILAVIFFSRTIWAADCSLNEHFDLGQQYFKKAQYLLSSLHFSTAQKSNCASLALKSKYNLILSFYQLTELQEVRDLTQELSTTNLGPDATFLRAIYLDENDSLKDMATKNRALLWRSQSDRNEFKTALQTAPLISEQKSSLEKQLQKVPRRSPAMATGMNALLPGAGYAYVGAWQTAALSLALNALFLAAAIDFGNHDMHGAEVAAYSVFSVTYIGSIIGGHRAAKDFNNEQMRPIREEWAASLFPETQPKR